MKLVARLAGHAGRAAALAAVFVAGAVGGVALHADLAASRRVAMDATNRILGGLFEGRLVLERIEHVEVGRHGRVRVARVEILDPQGRRALAATGVEGTIDLVRLLSSLASGGPPDVHLAWARVDGAEVVLDGDGGGLGIARAFAPTKDPTTPPPAPREDTGEDVRLRIDDAFVAHAWVHGDLLPPMLDGDADDVHGRVSILDEVLSIELDRARTTLRAPRAPLQALPLSGGAKGHLAIALSTSRLSGEAELHGDVAGVPVAARAAVDGERVEGSVDLPTCTPEALARAFPGLPVHAPLTLHATAEGTLPTLRGHATARLGSAEATASAEIDLREGRAFRADAAVRGFDARSVGGFASDLAARAHVEGGLVGSAPVGTFRVVSEPGIVEAQRVPAAVLEGRFEERTVTGTVRSSEPGLAATAKMVLDLPGRSLAFDAQARSNDLSSLARAPGVLRGAATARASGRVDLARAVVSGRITADAEHLSAGPVSAATLHAESTLEGPVGAPVLAATARASEVRLTAPGKEPLVYPAASASARLTLAPAPRVLDAALRVDAPGAPGITARAAAVRFDRGLVIEGGSVEGLGAPLSVDARVTPSGLALRTKAQGLDLRKAAALTGIEELGLLPEGTRGTVDVDLTSDAKRVQGHVDLVVAGGEGAPSGALHARFDGRRITGNARASLAGFGTIEVPHAELELEGPPSARALARAAGELELRGEVDLGRGAALLAGEAVERVDGTARISARIARAAHGVAPTLSATVQTRGLEVVPAGAAAPIAGVDGSIHLGYDGATDDTEVSLVAWDARGLLASAGAKGRVPLRSWVEGKASLDAATLAALDIGARAHVPERRLVDLPAWLAPDKADGAVAGDAFVEGPLARPSVRVVAQALGLVDASDERQERRYAPVDAVVEARWDGEDVVAVVLADERERERARPRARARSAGRARGLVLGKVGARDLLLARAEPLRWTASAELDVDGLELGPLPLPVRTAGVLTGRIRATDLHGSPSLEANARVEGLRVAGAPAADLAEIYLGARDGSLFAAAHVAQEDGGKARAQLASRALRWTNDALTWDAEQPTRLDYAAEHVRLGVLRPLLRGVAPDVDGLLDGHGSASFDARSQQFEGGLAIQQGRMYLNVLGEELTDVSAVAKFDKSGVFRIQDARGRVGSGAFRAAVAGRMEGLHFAAANAAVVVPPRAGVPLSAEGATFAEATGEVRIQARMSPDRETLLVDVDVPRADVELPDRGTQLLQSLEPDPTVDIGVRGHSGELAAVPLRPRRARAGVRARQPGEALSTRFTVSLGKDVHVEGRGIRVDVAGRTVVDLGDEVTVTGQIDLRDGTIDVQGRRFVVDHGTITFPDGDEPSNPTILAAAYWDAPDKSRVWVEFAGPLKTGKMTLRSEPPFTKNEILSLLLFGRPDGNVGASASESGGGAGGATAVGGGIVSSGLNRALDELGGDVEIETRIATTRAQRSRPEVGVRVRRDLTVAVGYVLGLPTPAEPDRTLVMIDWQFLPKWSVVATRGNKGTSILDLVFRHRY